MITENQRLRRIYTGEVNLTEKGEPCLNWTEDISINYTKYQADYHFLAFILTENTFVIRQKYAGIDDSIRALVITTFVETLANFRRESSASSPKLKPGFAKSEPVVRTFLP